MARIREIKTNFTAGEISSVVDRADNANTAGLGALDHYKKYKFS